MGMADAATVLWTEYLKHDPGRPEMAGPRPLRAFGRPRLDADLRLLHLTGYARPTIDGHRNFRQLGSPCAGHPENFLLDGVEATTGPAGAGRRHGGRHGDRRAAPQRRIWRRTGRPPHLGRSPATAA
jgi:transketolase